MITPPPTVDAAAAANQWHLLVALGIGLLIGLERERRKGAGRTREAAGVRTFALVALLGGLAAELGGVAVLAVCAAFIAAAGLVAYAQRRDDDPGLTTQVALMTTFLIGALTARNVVLAAGVGVVVAVLLAARTPLHRFVRDSLSEQEVHDGLVFAAAALVILPLVPDAELGPYGVFNPFVIWRLVVIVMAISAVGYIGIRLLGARLGLAVAGFAGGFVSSTVTLGLLGVQARKDPRLLRGAVAGAMLASLASIIELAVVIGATDPATLRQLALPLVLAGLVTGAYGGVFAVRALRGEDPPSIERGHAFDLKIAVAFAFTVTLVIFASAALRASLGTPGLVFGVGVAGLADIQAGAISVAGLVAAGKITPIHAVVPILAALSASTLTKAVLAVVTGGWGYAARVVPGLVLVLVGAWAGTAIAGIG
jgi:uncharacterized membrane protein (DUF4010 family)